MNNSNPQTVHRWTLRPACAAVFLALASATVYANPLDGIVAGGHATWSTSGRTLTVINTPGTIINWRSFSIGSGETTRFVQQSAASVVLNRVIGGDPSSILGTLQSNGRVFLLNPNGIVFGAGATVDVGGLVASTLNLSDADFRAGRNHFTQIPNAGDILNAGNITAHQGGQIYLIAPNVTNTGVITAPSGEILLAAGHSVDLVSTSDPSLRVSITAPAGDVTNLGRLISQAGSLGLFGTVVRNSGVVSADSATLSGGKIVFKASQRVEAGGRISARGIGGGDIKLLADMDTGAVNLTGALDASAPMRGNGGHIETSAAHVHVSDTARVVTTALAGRMGSWLIDPTDFIIAASGGSITGATLGGMLGSTNVTIQSSQGTIPGNGDIFVNDAITWGGATTLTLNAVRHINVNAAITNTSGGSLVMRSDMNATGVGTINFAGAGSVALSGGGRADLYYNPLSYTDFMTASDATGNPYTPFMGSTTYTAWMLVNNLTQLQAISSNLSGNYALGTNIDATAATNFTPLGIFSGQLNGLNHSISNLTINQSTLGRVGLFSELGMGAAVSNLTLANVNITGNTWVGALAGLNSGRVSNVHVTGTVTGVEQVGGLIGNNQPNAIIDMSSFSGAVVGVAGTGLYSGSAGTVGGLVGWNNADIFNSFARGSVTSVGAKVGGLVGFNQGVFTGNMISNSYAANVVTGLSLVGGLVGDNNNGTITNSYWDTQLSQLTLGVGNGPVSGAVGLTTAQMQQQSSFVGWDFTNVWAMPVGGYPTLRAATPITPITPTPVVPVAPIAPPAAIQPIVAAIVLPTPAVAQPIPLAKKKPVVVAAIDTPMGNVNTPQLPVCQ